MQVPLFFYHKTIAFYSIENNSKLVLNLVYEKTPEEWQQIVQHLAKEYKELTFDLEKDNGTTIALTLRVEPAGKNQCITSSIFRDLLMHKFYLNSVSIWFKKKLVLLATGYIEGRE